MIDAAEVELRRFSSGLARSAAAWPSLFRQSDSNTAWIFFAIRAFGDDDADLAPAVQLQLAQALAADEGRGAVADDGAHVQPQLASLRTLMPAIAFSSLPRIRISTPAFGALLQHFWIALSLTWRRRSAAASCAPLMNAVSRAREFSGLTTKRACDGV